MPVFDSDGTKLLLNTTQKPLGPVTLDPTNPINNGLVDYLIFNEGAGVNPANLSAPTAVQAPVNGTPTWRHGKTGPGGYGTGGVGFAIASHAPTLWHQGSFTARILFKPVTWVVGDFNNILEHATGFGGSRGLSVYCNTSGNLDFLAVNGGAAAASVTLGMTAGGEYDFVITYALGGDATFYVNGISKGTVTPAAPSAVGACSTILGSDWSSAGNHPDVVYFAHQVWNRVLTTQEIAYLAANPYGGVLPSEPELPALFISGVAATNLMAQIWM